MPIAFSNLNNIKKAVQPTGTVTAAVMGRAAPDKSVQLRQALASPNTDQDVRAYNTGTTQTPAVTQPPTYNRANEGRAAASQATAQSQPQQPISTTDFTSNIRQLYGDRLNSSNAAVDYATDNSVNQLNRQLGTLGQQYQPQRNQASVAGAQNLRSALEMSANAGDRGGVGRQNALTTQTSMQNQINDIDLQEQNARNEIQFAISDAIRQGDFQKAQNIAQNSSSLIEAIMNESIRNQTRQDTLAQQGFSNRLAEAGLTGMYGGGQTLAGQQLAADIDSQAFNNRIAEAGLTGLYGGNQTIQAQSQALQDAISLAGITGAYNGQQTMQGALNTANISSIEAQTAYQEAINKGYTDREAAEIASIRAQTSGQYLQNIYQGLLNKGYPAQQAAELAYTQAQTANTQANTNATIADGGVDTKVYTPKGQTISTSQVTQRLDDMLAMGASKDQLAQIVSTMYNNGNISKQLVSDLQRKYGLY